MTYARKTGVDHLVIIPRASWYVTAVDMWLSGRGEADGLESVAVVPCRNVGQGMAVARLLRQRGGLGDVVLSDHYPQHRVGRLYNLLDAATADEWYAGVS